MFSNKRRINKSTKKSIRHVKKTHPLNCNNTSRGWTRLLRSFSLPSSLCFQIWQITKPSFTTVFVLKEPFSQFSDQTVSNQILSFVERGVRKEGERNGFLRNTWKLKPDRMMIDTHSLISLVYPFVPHTHTH